MTDFPLLSVIIPVYNTENYLRECIESIRSQSYSNLEIILVDDGSTDSSGNICNEYASLDNRIVSIHKKNGGASSARNIGLDIARGEFITFIDSDDVIIGNALYEKVFNIFDENPLINIIQFGVIFKYNSPLETQKAILPKVYETPKKIFEGFLNYELHASCCDKIFRSNIIKNIRFVEGSICEDIAFIPDLIQNGAIIKTINEGWYGYRYREGSVSKSQNSPYWRLFSILKSHYKFLNFGSQYKELQTSIIKWYLNIYWGTLASIRTQYPTKYPEVCSAPIFLKLSLLEFLKLKLNNKRKAEAFILCCCGPKFTWKLQNLFTRNQ